MSLDLPKWMITRQAAGEKYTRQAAGELYIIEVEDRTIPARQQVNYYLLIKDDRILNINI